MSYRAVPVEDAAGLDYRNPTGSSPGGGGALEFVNLRVDLPGRLHSRGGCDERVNAATGPDTPLGLGYYRSQGRYMIVNASNVASVNPAGWGVTNFAALAGYSGDFEEMFGTMYLARTTGTLVSFTGAAVAAVAATPWAKFITAMPQEARLVTAYSGMVALNANRVHFSTYDPVAGTNTWGANDYVDLRPNDGQVIRAIVTWRDMVFVFKDNCYFVFHGSATKADGSAEFQFHAVDTGIGCAQDFCAVAGPDGVYFLGANGLYKTTGDAPELLSAPVQLLFDGGVQGIPGVIDRTNPVTASTRLAVSDEVVYIVDSSVAFTPRCWVYGIKTGTWGLWEHTAGAPVILFPHNPAGGAYLFVTASGALWEAFDGTAGDAGAGHSIRYKTAWTRFDPTLPVTVREVIVAGWMDNGSGVNVYLARDWVGTPELGPFGLALGTSAAPGTLRLRRAIRGRSFSLELGWTSIGEITTVTWMLRDAKDE